MSARQVRDEEFARWVQRRIDERGLSARGLARVVGVSPSEVRRWLKGGLPGYANLQTLLEYFGGDLKRAFPEYVMEESRPNSSIIGEIAEGGFHRYGPPIPTYLGTSSFETLPIYAKTTGPAMVVRLRRPHRYFPEGSELIVRKPRSTNGPSEGHCIAKLDRREDLVWLKKTSPRCFVYTDDVGAPTQSSEEPDLFVIGYVAPVEVRV